MHVLLEALVARDARIWELDDQVLELEEKYLVQFGINARQAKVISELERRVGLSRTNSKPPSSDGLAPSPRSHDVYTVRAYRSKERLSGLRRRWGQAPDH